MSTFLEYGLIGIASGAIYALMAQGLVLVYRGTGTLNFAQGAIAMVGGYTYYEARAAGLSFLVGLILALVICGGLGVLIYQLIMRRLKTASPLARVVATLGILLVLQSIAILKYGSQPVFVTPFLPILPLHFLGVTITELQIWMLGIAVLLTAALYLFSRKTLIGLALTALADNAQSSRSLGWSSDLLGAITWGVSGMVAAVAGILIIPLVGLQVNTIAVLIVPAMAAALLGMFSSYWLALLGGLVVGVLEAWATELVHVTGASDAVPVIVIVVLLVVRGRALPVRGYLVERLPQLGSGRIRPWILVVSCVALGLLVYLVLPEQWGISVSVTLAYAVVLLSIVTLSGYGGQLSLAQFIIAGVGALIAAKLVAAGWDLALALVVSVALSVFVGALFALPALRARGMNLAVATLGLGFAVQQVIFESSIAAGGGGGAGGVSVPNPTFLGLPIDVLGHEKNYDLLMILLFALAMTIVGNVRRSRAGRRIIAVRTNERAAAAIGISVPEAKVFAFSISALLAAIGGVMIGFQGLVAVNITDTFQLTTSELVVGLAVIGGLGYAIGAVFGATLAPAAIGSAIGAEFLGQSFDNWLPLIGGVFLILLLLQDPNGMASSNIAMTQKVWNRIHRRHRAAAPGVHVVR